MLEMWSPQKSDVRGGDIVMTEESRESRQHPPTSTTVWTNTSRHLDPKKSVNAVLFVWGGRHRWRETIGQGRGG